MLCEYDDEQTSYLKGNNPPRSPRSFVGGGGRWRRRKRRESKAERGSFLPALARRSTGDTIRSPPRAGANCSILLQLAVAQLHFYFLARDKKEGISKERVRSSSFSPFFPPARSDDAARPLKVSQLISSLFLSHPLPLALKKINFSLSFFPRYLKKRFTSSSSSVREENFSNRSRATLWCREQRVFF